MKSLGLPTPAVSIPLQLTNSRHTPAPLDLRKAGWAGLSLTLATPALLPSSRASRGLLEVSLSQILRRKQDETPTSGSFHDPKKIMPQASPTSTVRLYLPVRVMVPTSKGLMIHYSGER